jgi:hypothetical protein
LCLAVERVTDPNRFCLGGQLVDELLVDLLLDKVPGRTNASLPCSNERAEGSVGHRLVDIKVVKHDYGGFAA